MTKQELASLIESELITLEVKDTPYNRRRIEKRLCKTLYALYKTTNNVNGKIYIGQNKGNKRSYFGSGTHISRAIRKYGKNNFSKEILEFASTIEEANEREEFYISYFESTNPEIGYNLTSGGKQPETTIRKRGWKHSEETKQKMRQSALNLSKEFKTNRGKSQVGRKQSKETLDKIKASRKYESLPDSVKEKLSESLRDFYSNPLNRLVWINNGMKNARVRRGNLKEYLQKNVDWKEGKLSSKQ